jgi:hypothetical protein
MAERWLAVNRRFVLTLVAVSLAVAALAVAACGTPGVQSEPAGPASAGQVVRSRDVQMSLVSASFADGVLTASFAMENVGGLEFFTTPRFNFEAADDLGNPGELVTCTNAPYPLLSFRVRTGAQVKGSMCWRLSEGAKSFVIHYRHVANGPVTFTFGGQLP